MEKLNNKPKKVICPRCRGNGYIKIPHESVEKLNKSVITQCTMCKSQGEIDELENKIYDIIPNINPNRMH